MNIVSMKKKLLEGKFPGQPGATLRLTEKQLKYLVATVPCVRIHNKNATQYYFVEASVFLQVHFYGGMGRCDIKGSLFEVPSDYDQLKYEDGIGMFPVSEDKRPLVFKYPEEIGKAKQLILALQRALWLNKHPYHVKIDGYESAHKKGWPKNSQFGGPQITLSINDGDFETVYLIHEDILNHHTYTLKQAVLNGEFDGSESTEVFEDRISKEAQERHQALELKLEFENFVKENPLQAINDGIESYNDDIDTYKKFLKMAKALRKTMKENPECFNKIKKVKNNHGQKNSTLFRETERIKDSMKHRRDIINNHDEGLHRAIEKAVEEWNE